MKVGQYGIWDVPQRSRKGGLAGPGVGAYTQYLGILPLEVRVGDAERGDLVGSTACEREDVEGQHHVLLALELAQSYVFTVLAR